MPDLELRPATVDNGHRRGWRATLTVGRKEYSTEHEVPAGALSALIRALAEEIETRDRAARQAVNSAVFNAYDNAIIRREVWQELRETL